jgi:cellobiose-specific phosphotransferase system component IIC
MDITNVLREVVTPGKLLATLVTFKGLVLSIKGIVVSFEMYIPFKSAVANIVDKCLKSI